MELEPIKHKIVAVYRRNKATLSKLEKQLLLTPTGDLHCQVAEMRGFLRGLYRLDEIIEDHQTHNDLPGIE